MSKRSQHRGNYCSICRIDFEPQWYVCPNCGTRLNLVDDLAERFRICFVICFAFVIGEVGLASVSQDLAIVFGILIGLPLVYSSCKSTYKQVFHSSITWRELGTA